MLNFDNATIPTTEEKYEPVESARQVTAKEILEEMDAILKELTEELVRIDNAIYSPRAGKEKDDPRDECLLGTLSRQRDTAQALLGIAIHIREGLW